MNEKELCELITVQEQTVVQAAANANFQSGVLAAYKQMLEKIQKKVEVESGIKSEASSETD